MNRKLVSETENPIVWQIWKGLGGTPVMPKKFGARIQMIFIFGKFSDFYFKTSKDIPIFTNDTFLYFTIWKNPMPIGIEVDLILIIWILCPDTIEKEVEKSRFCKSKN